MAYTFVPTMFISVGEQRCFFTLRETYEHVTYIDRVPHYDVRSYHHFNLSQDPAEAMAKAQAFAAQSGLQLTTTLERLQCELNEIKRADADEMARRARVAAEIEAEREAQRAELDAQMRQVIAAGFFPFGRFCGLAFEQAERGYLQWVIAKREEFEADTYMRLIADKLALEYSEYAAPQFDPVAVIGEPGERLTLDVKIIKAFAIDTDYGRSYIVTMVTNGNVCLISFGAFFAEVGEELKIKGTVKCHDEYNGQAQTRLQRIKKLA